MNQIIPIPAFKDNYIWLIRSQSDNYCSVVDPGDATPVIQYLQKNNLLPTTILITHHHHDHSGGISKLLEYYPNLLIYGPACENIVGLTNPLEAAQMIAISRLQLQFQVIHIPGHTRGHIAYYGHNLLFCGDTLFAAGCGRLFEGTPAEMLSSLKTLAALPDTTQLFCGHEYTVSNLRFALAVEPQNSLIQQRYQQAQQHRQQNIPTLPSNIALEKQTNPFLRTQLITVKHAAEQFAGQALNSEVEVFSAIREWKNNFS